jgi:hypothetical protein
MATQRMLHSKLVLLALTAVCLLGSAGCSTLRQEPSELDRIHSVKVDGVLDRMDNALDNSNRNPARRQIASP